MNTTERSAPSALEDMAEDFWAIPIWVVGTHLMCLLFVGVAVAGVFYLDAVKQMIAVLVCCATELVLTLYTGIYAFSGGNAVQSTLMLCSLFLSALLTLATEVLWAAHLGIIFKRELFSLHPGLQTKALYASVTQWNRPFDLENVELEEEEKKKEMERERDAQR